MFVFMKEKNSPHFHSPTSRICNASADSTDFFDSTFDTPNSLGLIS
jgi:hypothetical protein